MIILQTLILTYSGNFNSNFQFLQQFSSINKQNPVYIRLKKEKEKTCALGIEFVLKNRILNSNFSFIKLMGKQIQRFLYSIE